MWAWIRDKTQEVIDVFAKDNPSLNKELNKIKEIASEKAKQDCNRHKRKK